MLRKKEFYHFAWKEFKRRIFEHNIFGYGAQMAYFFVLSVFPFMIFLVGILSYFSLSYDGFFTGVAEVVPADVVRVMDEYVRELAPRTNFNYLSLSALVTIWSASRGIHALRLAVNRAYGVSPKRTYWRKRVLSIVYTLTLMMAIIFALTLPSMGKEFVRLIETALGVDLGLVKVLLAYRWPFIVGFFFAVISFFYYVTFERHNRWREVVPGTLFAMAGWVVLSQAFSMFVNSFGSYALIYGSLGAMVVLMVWFYMSGIVLMLGGEINSIYHAYKFREFCETFKPLLASNPCEKGEEE